MADFNLDEYRDSDDFAPVDWEFADLVVRRTPGGDDRLRLLSAMALASVRASHSCLDLTAWRTRPRSGDALLPSPLTPEEWARLIETFPTAICCEREAAIEGPESVVGAPLVFVPGANLLYLAKYRAFERAIRERVLALAAKRQAPVPPSEVHTISRYFMKNEFEEDMQQRAAGMALARSFAIVTGGPGTGKTTVLAAILALELKRNPSVSITLCAPTGKAAARMRESIARELDETTGSLTPELAPAIRTALASLKPVTLHKLIEVSPKTGLPYRNASNTLQTDLVVVDECSMASLSLFHALIQALPDNARLLLLGDKDQLASVEAGVVFADLCQAPSLRDNVVCLTQNHRYANNQALKAFVEAVAASQTPDYESLYDGTYPDFHTVSVPDGASPFRKRLEELLASILNEADIKPISWHDAKSPEDAFGFCERFKILCAVHDGRYGVNCLNDAMRTVLNIDNYGNGMPIIVTRNDPVTGLSNGDVGVCFNAQIWFPSVGPGAGARVFRPFRRPQLPPHDCAFAMTVHKSQGSDYANVLLVLPDSDNPVLSRELVYTGITRTRERCLLIAPRDILKTAVARPTARWSGLAALMTPNT